LCQGRSCGAQPHSLVFVCFGKPAKAFTPVNSHGRPLPFLEPTEHRLISTQPVCEGLLCQAHDTFEELLQAIAPDRAGCETSIIGTFRRPLDP
jgi:hypothetical protein